jgi:hypothetical protein
MSFRCLQNTCVKMINKNKDITLLDARAYLDNLDLGYIVESMCAPSYSLPRWTNAEATLCCDLYKKFLLLQKMHLPTQLVPTRQIDEFWHNHILYTKNYSADCMQIFGHYLHHEPAAPSDSATDLINDFLKTKALFKEAFGYSL